MWNFVEHGGIYPVDDVGGNYYIYTQFQTFNTYELPPHAYCDSNRTKSSWKWTGTQARRQEERAVRERERERDRQMSA